MSFFVDDVQFSLSKSGHGEGARGGHIVGHTKSGKPIYANSHQNFRSRSKGVSFHEEHKDFNHQDHKDAAALLNRHAKSEYNEGRKMAQHVGIGSDPADDRAGVHHHFSLSDMHAEDAVDHAKAAAGMGIKSFTGDHAEAHARHRAEGDKYRGKLYQVPDDGTEKSQDRGQALASMMHHHYNLAEMHAAKGGISKSLGGSEAYARLTRLAKAEGSRGGHIIGRTKSGKPIYEAKGTKRELLHKLDHGLNHVAVASSLKHKNYIGMTSAEHHARAVKHQAKAVSKFKAAGRAATVAESVKKQRLGNQHMSLSRAHAMMGQLSAEVRMPDHLRDTASMGGGGTVDKERLQQTKDRYFSTLGKAGHKRALTRHTRLKNEADVAGHEKTAEHHGIMANAHVAILAHHYGDKG